MKITRLQSQNVMRLTAVDITPDGNLVIIGGLNGAGKSSVLDSIAMALGGATLAPTEPIRTGESEAKITINLGDDCIVTRKFTRELVDDVPGAADACKVWGETHSTLIVANKEGARYPSPQALLDKFLGKLTFDPLAFAHEGKTTEGQKRQAETLRRLVGLDTSTFENARRKAFDERAMLRKTLKIKEAQLLALPNFKDAPKAETSLDVVSGKMLEAERLRKLADDAEREVEKSLEHRRSLAHIDHQININIAAITAKIEELQQHLTEERLKGDNLREKLDAAATDTDIKTAAAQAARTAVPDVEVIRQELSTTEGLNAKVRANAQYASKEAELTELGAQIVEQGRLVDAADREKQTTLEAAKFPVEGLGLDDHGVTFNGLPFSQASSSEQLRVSVAIGLALNPTLKVLLIRSGNLLDENSLKLVAEQATQADAQLWMEYVTADSGNVQVMIEDGHVSAKV